MMLSKMLTVINLLGAMISVTALSLTMRNYLIGSRMQYYIFLSFASMVLLIFTQWYVLSYDIETNWKVKFAVTFWWAKTLYFSWAIRFSSLKK